LTRAGLKKDDRILDYGCGSGVFLQYLKQRGYGNCFGYDPYVLEFKRLPAEMGPFDCVVNNDTIEHCDDVRAMLRQCIELLKPGGLLYVGTSDSEPVNMQCLEPEIMRFHQPFHRIMLTQKSLRGLVGECGLELIRSYRRSYHDTLNPFVNYRFLDELNKAVGHNLDRALDPTVGSVVSRSPRLWFYGLFGYLFPTAYEPAVIARKPETVWRGTGS
jgi:SAM-dependent methyltransferase